jgi:cytochrome c7-like protein
MCRFGAETTSAPMPQVFQPSLVLAIKFVLLGAALLLATGLLVYRLNIRRDAPQHAPVAQPVPFSHKHHVGDDGIDCRYCHTSVETSAFAGVPPLETCMTCHAVLFTDAPVLAPLLTAYRSGNPLMWNRVNDLPDFVYFNHSIHISKGVGCVTCHGEVDQMPLTSRAASLDMQWCLGCHRAPEQHLRPRDRVFDLHWRPPADRVTLGLALKKAYHVRSALELTQCSVCHR